MRYFPSMGERKRRARHEGGLYRKTAYLVDSEGERRPYTYWQASMDVPVEHLPPGVTRKRITGSGPTQSMALDRCRANFTAWVARSQGDSPRRVTRRRHKNAVTLDEWFTLWRDHLRYTETSETMQLKYAQMYRDHIGPFLGATMLAELNAAHIRILLNAELVKERTLAPKKAGGKERKVGPLGASARKNVYRTLSVMLNYAVSKSRILASPIAGVEPPTIEREEEEVEHLADNAIQLMSDLRAQEHPDYCRMLLQFLGLRQSERLGLTWSKLLNLDALPGEEEDDGYGRRQPKVPTMRPW